MTKLKFAVAPLVATLMLAGCTLGPDYRTVELDAPSLNQAAASQGLALEGDWWQTFGDPTLVQLVHSTLQHNPSLAAARANMRAAYAVFDDAGNDGLPKGTVGVDYQVQDQLMPGGGDERINNRSLRVGAGLSWTLDLFGRIERTAQAAHHDAEASRYAWHDLQLTLVSRVAETYAGLRGLEARIEVAKSNVTSLVRTLGVIRARVDAGYASELDLLRVEAQLKGVEARIPALEADAERARSVLLALAGGEQVFGEWHWLAAELPELSEPVALENPVQLLRRRADVLAAEQKLAAATARIGASEAALYPELSVSGFLGFLSPSASLLGNQSKAWQVAPSLSWPVFDLASLNARVDIANARQAEALAGLQQKWLDVVTEARIALSDYAKSQQQSHLLSAQVAASSRALKLAQLQYDSGAIDLLDLLDSERTALAARENRVQASTQTFIALARVYRAFGGEPNLSQPEAG